VYRTSSNPQYLSLSAISTSMPNIYVNSDLPTLRSGKPVTPALSGIRELGEIHLSSPLVSRAGAITISPGHFPAKQSGGQNSPARCGQCSQRREREKWGFVFHLRIRRLPHNSASEPDSAPCAFGFASISSSICLCISTFIVTVGGMGAFILLVLSVDHILIDSSCKQFL